MSDAMFETRLLVALLWIGLCVLARTDRERDIMRVGTIVLLVTLMVSAAFQ